MISVDTNSGHYTSKASQLWCAHQSSGRWKKWHEELHHVAGHQPVAACQVKLNDTNLQSHQQKQPCSGTVTYIKICIWAIMLALLHIFISLHCVGFAAACLTIRKYSGVIAGSPCQYSDKNNFSTWTSEPPHIVVSYFNTQWRTRLRLPRTSARCFLHSTRRPGQRSHPGQHQSWRSSLLQTAHRDTRVLVN